MEPIAHHPRQHHDEHADRCEDEGSGDEARGM